VTFYSSLTGERCLVDMDLSDRFSIRSGINSFSIRSTNCMIENINSSSSCHSFNQSSVDKSKEWGGNLVPDHVSKRGGGNEKKGGKEKSCTRSSHDNTDL
jgi:hypothetical protein